MDKMLRLTYRAGEYTVVSLESGEEIVVLTKDDPASKHSILRDFFAERALRHPIGGLDIADYPEVRDRLYQIIQDETLHRQDKKD